MVRRIRIAKMDPEIVADEIGDFIVRSILAIPDFSGGVIGLSGGVDSTVCAALAKRAFDKHNQHNERKLELIGYLLPSNVNSPLDAEDGKKVADRLSIKCERIDIQPVVESFRNTNPLTFLSNVQKGNLMAEIRAVILHQKAATSKKLVLGTGNKDEDFSVGYYTLFGDGAVHISPIGNLPKRLVKEMARFLGFNDLADRVPTAGLEPGQTDFGDLGYKYESAEIVMNGLEQGLDINEIIEDDLFIESSSKDLYEYAKLYKKSKFKNNNEIINDIVRRNNIAKVKGNIVHPPIPPITLDYSENKKLKVALFGGSFNPIHNGHLYIADELIKRKIVNEVWFIPCGNHAFDKKLISGNSRLEMINLAIKNKSHIKSIGVELDPDKKSYTSDTIKWFKKEFNQDYYFIIGADNIKDMEKWHDYEYLKNNVKFILVTRPGFKIENHDLKIFYTLEIENEISSTNIRDCISNGTNVKELLTEEVDLYIKKEGLYK